MIEWNVVKLGDIAEVQTGPFGSQLHQSDYVPQGVPCIMPTNIGQHLDIISEGIAHISKQDASRLSRHLVQEGDIVYSRRGDIEKCAFIQKEQTGWFCGTGCLRVRLISEEVYPHYVAYYLSTPAAKAWIVGNAVGSTMPNLNTGILKDLEIPMPSLPEQKRIAAILSSLDDKIENNRKINKNLEGQAQALFKSWLSAATADLTIGDISESVNDFSRCTKDKVVLINSSDVTEGFFDHHEESDNKDLKGHFKKRFQKGDILYSQVRPRNRHWAYCDFEQDNYLCSTQLMIIRNKPSKVTSILLYYYLISDSVWEEFTLKTETRSGTFPQGNFEEMSAIRVPYSEDQANITAQLESIRKRMFSNYKENIRLAQLRDTLLPKLMNGEIALLDRFEEE